MKPECPDPIVSTCPEATDEDKKLAAIDAALLRGYKAQARAKHKEAKESFESALALQPENPDATEGLAWSFLGLRQYERAANLFETLLDFDTYGQRIRVFFGLGKAYAGLDRYVEAKSHFASYLDRAPAGLHSEEARVSLKDMDRQIRRRARAGDGAKETTAGGTSGSIARPEGAKVLD